MAVFVDGATINYCNNANESGDIKTTTEEIGHKILINVPELECKGGYYKIRGICRRVYKVSRNKRSPNNHDPCKNCVPGYYMINGRCIFAFE